MSTVRPSEKQRDLLSWLTHFYGYDNLPAATVSDLFRDFHYGAHLDPEEPEHEPRQLSWRDYSYEGIRAALKRLAAHGLVEQRGAKPPYGWQPTRSGLRFLADAENWEAGWEIPVDVLAGRRE